ncbi:MAG TPA: LptE family protein [Chitinophagales bacterium]|nr:LptE family protein [Chitinophagales bacterium]HRK28609.1 LptE family protein [Chitinophagales bacterium]
MVKTITTPLQNQTPHLSEQEQEESSPVSPHKTLPNRKTSIKLPTTLFFSLAIAALMLLGNCYSFKGISIAPGVKTVSVEDFPNLATTVAPALSQTIVEKMKNKFAAEARLDLVPSGGHAAFSGSILNYFVEPAASGAGDQAALNRLTIVIRVEYTNSITDENWSQTFQQFENFDRNANLADVEGQLIDLIVTRLVDDIFNKAFTNW